MSAVLRAGLSRYAYQGRHRSPEPAGPTAARSAALGAGVAAAVLLGTATPATAASGGDPWYRLRQCESGGNYSINTGNGYYGAYQFDAGTWHAYGGRGLPSQASKAEQDYRAKLLYQARGWSPWPGCARRLGLREDPAYGRTGPAPRRHPVTISGPATAGLQATYRISGTSRPSSRVVVRIRQGSTGAWHAYPKRTDSAGRWSVPWRARTDYQYRVVGETTSPVRGTRVATTAAAAAARTQRLAGGAGPAVTVGGTSRPGTRVVLYVRSATGRWHGWAKFSAGRTGRWTLDLQAPSRAFQYYAVATNGQRSRIRSLTV